jgi:hypothetical protein
MLFDGQERQAMKHLPVSHPGIHYSGTQQSGTHRSGTHYSGIKYMLAGGTVVAALGLLVDPRSLLSKPTTPVEACQEVPKSGVVLSRDQLSQLLSIPEGSSKEQLRQVMPVPYCQLRDLQVRAGSVAQRDVYPLAFDPQTWLVVLYEGDRYAGYSFSFRH